MGSAGDGEDGAQNGVTYVGWRVLAGKLYAVGIENTTTGGEVQLVEVGAVGGLAFLGEGVEVPEDVVLGVLPDPVAGDCVSFLFVRHS